MITSYFKTKEDSTKNDVSERLKRTKNPCSSTTLAFNNPNPQGRKRRKHDDEESNQKDSFLSSISPQSNKNYSNLSTDVQELMSHLEDESWKTQLFNHISKPSFNKLAKFVSSERASKKIVYPPPCDVFSALNTLPIEKVKVVIVGQDPYHQPNQGHGLAFSVRKGIKIPPSLRNIYKELLNNNNCGLITKIPTHGYLNRWCDQGVLLLNAVLTVRKNEANSHAKRGWEEFTDEIIRILVSQKNKKIVFLLWGKPASKKAESIIQRYGGRGKHTIITSSHPSPLGATKTKSPFIGSRCFSRANDALVDAGLTPIDWGVDDDASDSDKKCCKKEESLTTDLSHV